MRHSLTPPAVALLVAASGFTPSPLHAQRPDGLYAEIHTTKGLIVTRLEPELVPLAVANFVGLAEGTIENAAFDPGRPFFDGTVYHRVVPGHVIQAGAPASERANGPGYTFPNEIHASLSHDHAGALQMANGGPHTNASQFCITLGDRSYLDGDYIVFGEVVQGMDVVMSVVQGDAIDSVRIARIGEKARAYRVTTASFRSMAAAAEARVAEHESRKREAERAWIGQRWPDVQPVEGEVATLERTVPDARGAAAADSSAGAGGARAPVRVRYRGIAVRYMAHMIGWQRAALRETMFGSGEDGVPGFNEPPLAFAYEPGVTTLNPGLDAVIAEMRPGERRVVLVPAALAYGRSGLYTPERPGEPRFVISPNTMLVYDVEVVASPRPSRALLHRNTQARPRLELGASADAAPATAFLPSQHRIEPVSAPGTAHVHGTTGGALQGLQHAAKEGSWAARSSRQGMAARRR